MNGSLETTIVITTASRVRGYLEAADDWRTVDEIAAAINRSHYEVRNELANQITRGHVVKELSEGRGRRQRYRWRGRRHDE